MKVYRKKKQWIIYIFILTIISSLVACKLLLPPNYISFPLPMVIAISLPTAMFLFFEWKRSKDKITVKKNSIVYQNYLWSQEVPFNYISGFETRWIENKVKYYVLKPKNERYRSMKIDLGYKNVHELMDWVTLTFEDLWKTKEYEKKAEAFQNMRYGMNPVAREVFIKQAHKTANLLNGSGLLLILIPLAFNFFFSTLSVYWLVPGLVLALATIVALIYFKGVLKIMYRSLEITKIVLNKRGIPKIKTETLSVYKDVGLALIGSGIAVMCSVLPNYVVPDFTIVWPYALFTALLLTIICLSATQEFQMEKLKSYLKFVFTIVGFFGFAYASIIGLNSIFDSSEPLKVEGKIVQAKEQSVKMGTDYYITIKSPVLNKPIKLEVDKKEFETITINDPYTFELHKGFFNISWAKDFF